MSAVVDTSPLIALASLDLLHLLPDLYGDIFVPDAVRFEAVDARPDAPHITLLRDALASARFQIRPPGVSRPSVPGIDLGFGESQAITLARLVRADFVVLDDRQARSAALRLGLTVVGTVGVLVAARDDGMIAAVAPLLERLQARGFRITPTMIERVRAGDPRPGPATP